MKNCTINITSEKDKSINIQIEGELVLQNILELKEKILEAKKSKAKTYINFDNISNIDLSGIQLVYSLRKSNPGKIVFGLTLAEEVKSLIEKTGFKEIIS